eukprot:TCONS_00054236-protein
MSDNTSQSSSKSKGVLTSALRKVQKQVQPTLTVQIEALTYLEDLLLQLLQQICSIEPHTIGDVETYLNNKFPAQIREWAINTARSAVEKKKKKTVTLPVDKLLLTMQKEYLGYKIEPQLGMYIVAVVEYISADILKLAGNYVKNIRSDQITALHIKIAMHADPVILTIFNNEPELHIPLVQPSPKRGSLSYTDVLKDFILSEGQYIRDLNLIYKVFQQPMLERSDLFSEDDIETLFGGLSDIYETTIQFYSMIENAFDVTEEGKEPLIGDCFEEMVEAAEFDTYEMYAECQLEEHEEGTRGKIYELLEKSEICDFFREKGLLDVVRYVLPKLLYGPIYHFADYYEYVQLLLQLTPDKDVDRKMLDQSLDALRHIYMKMERIISQPPLKRSVEDKVFFQQGLGTAIPNATAKIVSIQENIEGWMGKHISQISSLFLREGMLSKPAQDGKKETERKAFLFDNLLVLTKQNQHTITGFGRVEYRFKERINLRKAEIKNIEDTEETKNCFEITEFNESPVLFCCKDEEMKYDWLSILMTLQHRTTLDRMLDVILQEEEQSIQLKLPDPSVYIYAEEDADDNIIFEEQSEDDTGAPVIRGGTLYKLVERLTYHKYGDPTFIRVFLTTFRSFTTPAELLDLLIKRYDIPEPAVVEDNLGSDPNQQSLTRDEMKRFKKEYMHPIQVRVLNVLRRWVDHHFYDFTREDVLIRQLNKFLKRIEKTRAAKKWVENIQKLTNKRLEALSLGPETYTFNEPPPPIEWHLTKDPAEFTLLKLHPLEIGRQITLMQSEIFRSIRPSELVGSVWQKNDKEKLSPNALKMMRLSNLLTYWYETNLCEAQNFEERLAIYNRIIDLLMVFIELNNFNGISEIIGFLDSSPVHRMKIIKEEFQKKSPARHQAIEYVKGFFDRQYIKYNEKLRSINPPCIPFLGVYLRNILLSEEGNPDFLTNTDNLINFSKRRMVAEAIGDIQKYQNMPYNLAVDEDIRNFLENLDPFQGRETNDMNNYLFERSLEVEPRHAKKLPAFPRTSDIPLKSPGIKAGQSKYGTHGKKQSQSVTSQISVEVPATPLPSDLEKFDLKEIEDEAPDVFFKDQPQDEEPPPLPPPLLLPRQQPAPAPKNNSPTPAPLKKRTSRKQIIAPIEEEDLEALNRINELPSTPAPTLPPRQRLSNPNAPEIIRDRTRSAPPIPPSIPPRRPPLGPRTSEGAPVSSISAPIRPPDLPPRKPAQR